MNFPGKLIFSKMGDSEREREIKRFEGCKWEKVPEKEREIMAERANEK